MTRLVPVAVALACAGAVIMASTRHESPADQGPHRLAVFDQTVLAVAIGEPLRFPSLVDADGVVFAPERLRGHWNLIFFGLTSCHDVCPITLQALGAVARDPASGVAAGTTQIVFVSVDPKRDTPQRLKSYLEHVGGREILGLTGRREAIDRLSAEVGAASRAFGAGIDHSTSLFVLDPHGRLAGILLGPVNPARIVADLGALRTANGNATHLSRAH